MEHGKGCADSRLHDLFGDALKIIYVVYRRNLQRRDRRQGIAIMVTEVGTG